MKARSEYYLKCLANRVAGLENTRKRFTIDWKYARIEEDKNAQIEDMDFLLNNTVGGQTQKRGIRGQFKGHQAPGSISGHTSSNIDSNKKEVTNINDRSGEGLF